MSNLDRFYEAQFQAVKQQFESGDDAYEEPCLRLLADPRFSLYRRVTCCYMVAHNPLHTESYLTQAFDVLGIIETMIDEGHVGGSFRPWTVRVRTNLDRLKAEISSAKEEESNENQTDNEEEEEEEGGKATEEGEAEKPPSTN